MFEISWSEYGKIDALPALLPTPNRCRYTGCHLARSRINRASHDPNNMTWRARVRATRTLRGCVFIPASFLSPRESLLFFPLFRRRCRRCGSRLTVRNTTAGVVTPAAASWDRYPLVPVPVSKRNGLRDHVYDRKAPAVTSVDTISPVVCVAVWCSGRRKHPCEVSTTASFDFLYVNSSKRASLVR